MQIGDKFYFNPDEENSQKYYSERANWANENKAVIVEIGTVDVEIEEKYQEPIYDEKGGVTGFEEKKRIVTKTLRQFQIQAIQEPTIEEKQASVRQIRNSYLEQFVDPIASNPLRWNDLSEEEQQDIKDYRRYLLDFTNADNWWLENPLTFEEWIINK